MMSSGNKGVGVCVDYSLLLQRCGFCVGFGGIWQLVSVCVFILFVFLVCKIGDRGAVVRLLVVF